MYMYIHVLCTVTIIRTLFCPNSGTLANDLEESTRERGGHFPGPSVYTLTPVCEMHPGKKIVLFLVNNPPFKRSHTNVRITATF